MPFAGSARKAPSTSSRQRIQVRTAPAKVGPKVSFDFRWRSFRIAIRFAPKQNRGTNRGGKVGRAPFDVAVVGGGVNGCGIARDAAGRGLSVLLCEMADLASGTSSASTKLIHGGLRYLE